MKFTQQDISVLESFSLLNQTLLFPEGKRIVTKTSSELVLEYELDNEIDQEFWVSDLTYFIKCLKIVNEPTIHIEKNQIVLENNFRTMKVTLHDKATLKNLYSKKIKLTDGISFSLTKEQFVTMHEAVSKLGLPNIELIGKNGLITMKASYKQMGKSTNAFQEKLLEYNGKDFSFVFPEYFNLFRKDEYDIIVNEIVKLSSKTLPLAYYTPEYVEN